MAVDVTEKQEKMRFHRGPSRERKAVPLITSERKASGGRRPSQVMRDRTGSVEFRLGSGLSPAVPRAVSRAVSVSQGRSGQWDVVRMI